jgi:hypothetical protein
MPDTKPKGKPERKPMQLQVEPGIAAGRYASLVVANTADHETQITFIAQDLMTGAQDSTVGHVVARVYLANDRVRAMADMLVRQADAIDKARKAAPSK